ncbi:MAG: 2Fe-2S iron-sulfur cluster-binding protein, partial [Proteobacteria bacterium]|nr:2Fe-2S iron-sulfur cluster-binding protein [Pseudomonadota bacterium]
MAINFVLNGETRTETTVSPTRTVLEYLREDLGLTGTKEGCAEGDCGACSIVMVRNGSGRVEAVNSCLLTMGQLDGTRLATVEGLSEKGGELEAVQAAIVDEDGTQCGFCTPGFVMALHAFRHSGEPVSDGAIHDALAGNLCRCTGYRSIVAAAHAATSGNVEEPALTKLPEPPATELYEAQGQSFLSPSSLEALVAARV